MPVVVVRRCTARSPVVAAALKHAAARRPRRLRDDRRRRAAAGAVATSWPTLRERGLLDGTVTAGHAFGGDLEAVNVPSALALAAHVPTPTSSSSAWARAWSAPAPRSASPRLEVADVLDAAAALGGRADRRPARVATPTRGRATRASATTPAPPCDLARSPVHRRRCPRRRALGPTRDHDVVEVDVPDVAALLDDAGLDVTTMGRGPGRGPAVLRRPPAAAGVARGASRAR